MKKGMTKRFRLLQWLLVVGVFVSLIIPQAVIHGEETDQGEEVIQQIQQAGFIKSDQPLESKQQVQVGIYPVNVYNMDYSANTFNLSAYVWYRWKGEEDPTASMEFVNVVEQWGLMSTPIYPSPKELPDGSKYQIFKVNGMFYQTFDLHSYPLDHQKLSIIIEDSSKTYNELVYVADVKSSGYDNTLSVPGWDIEKLTATSNVHDYATDFGDTSLGKDGSKYTSLHFTIEIKRNINFFLFKLLLPLLIVLFTNWVALAIKPELVEVRTAMPATALLTIIFLQMSYSDKLPNVSYLVFLDKIYVLVYLMVIATLLQIVWTNRKVKSGDAEVIKRVVRNDHIALLVHIVVFALAFTVLLLNG